MRYYLFSILLMLGNAAQGLEFKRCVDSQGVAHFTNLPLSTLDANCKQQIDAYSLYLRYDYQRLQEELFESNEPDEKNPSSTLNSVADLVRDALDPDKALESLLQNTREQRANPASRFFRARTDAVIKILNAE